MKKIVVALIAIVVIVGGGISVYAYESPDVTNGNPLYGLKRSIENLEGMFANTDEAQAEFHLKMAMRRLDESQVLAAKGIVDEATITAINTETKEGLSKFDAIKDPEVRAKVLALYKNRLNNQLKEMDEENDNENETGTGSTFPHNYNENEYRNYGQARSDEVNKGQQGERMKDENAKNKVKDTIKKNIKETEDKEKELGGENIGNESQKNENRNSSDEINKGQKGKDNSTETEHVNPKVNMNVKTWDWGE